MRHRITILLFLLTGLHFLAVYGFMVSHWLEDFRTGVYERHYAEAFGETLILVIYLVLAIRFLVKRLGSF